MAIRQGYSIKLVLNRGIEATITMMETPMMLPISPVKAMDTTQNCSLLPSEFGTWQVPEKNVHLPALKNLKHSIFLSKKCKKLSANWQKVDI